MSKIDIGRDITLYISLIRQMHFPKILVSKHSIYIQASKYIFEILWEGIQLTTQAFKVTFCWNFSSCMQETKLERKHFSQTLETSYLLKSLGEKLSGNQGYFGKSLITIFAFSELSTQIFISYLWKFITEIDNLSGHPDM